jgi:hypothetical protein
MKLVNGDRKWIALVCILICVGIISVYLLYEAVTPHMTGIPGKGQPTNEAPDTIFRCFIIEYNQSFAKDALVFHLTDADLEDYPEYRRGMEGANTSTMEWREGKRYISEVQDCSEQLWSFDLCLQEYSRSDCLSHLKLYEYQGRYFEIRCIPSQVRS